MPFFLFSASSRVSTRTTRPMWRRRARHRAKSPASTAAAARRSTRTARARTRSRPGRSPRNHHPLIPPWLGLMTKKKNCNESHFSWLVLYCTKVRQRWRSRRRRRSALCIFIDKSTLYCTDYVRNRHFRAFRTARMPSY